MKTENKSDINPKVLLAEQNSFYRHGIKFIPMTFESAFAVGVRFEDVLGVIVNTEISKNESVLDALAEMVKTQQMKPITMTGRDGERVPFDGFILVKKETAN